MKRRPRQRFDWVYRGLIGVPGDEGEPGDGWFNTASLASYHSLATTITAGRTGATAIILYDSVNRLSTLANTWNNALGSATVGALSRAARAEGRKALVKRVQGQVLFRPSSWALGNVMTFGWRLGVYEQDSAVGSLLLDAEYSIFDNTLEWSTHIAVWANDHGNIAERRYFKGFRSDDPAPGIMVPFDIRFRRSLPPNMCLALYMEVGTSSVNITHQPWLRTLVHDEG